MVKRCIQLYIFMFLLYSTLVLAQVDVETTINQDQAVTNRTIKGTITITRNKDDTIDPQSFELDGEPLLVRLIKEENIGAERADEGLIVSIYEFSLPPKPAGLYMLSPITVKVGDRTYQSAAISYEVTALSASSSKPIVPTASKPTSTRPAATQRDRLSTHRQQTRRRTSQETPQDQNIIFQLEAFVEGPTPLYPGQRARLYYRIIFNRIIELTSSHFPLLHTTDFKKIGDIQIKDYEEKGVWVQDLWQEIEAAEPGVYTYGPSFIEGRAYRSTTLGYKSYYPNILRAEAPAIEIVVRPLPEANQPASYTGSLGRIAAKLTLLTPAEVQLEETIRLDLAISGASNLNELKLPPLQCQPGFSGFFQLSDLPPASEIRENTKHFTIELRPLSTLIDAIPPIEISSFDLAKQEFQIWRSQPIAIKVQANPLGETNMVSTASSNSDQSLENIWTPPNIEAPDLQETSIFVKSEDLRSSWLRSPWVLWAIPLSFLIAWLWHRWRQNREQRLRQAILPPSEIYLREGLEASNENAAAMLEKAFIALLKEQGYDWPDEENKTLTGKPLDKDTRLFLLDLQTLSYSPDQTKDYEAIKRQATEQFDRIKRR